MCWNGRAEARGWNGWKRGRVRGMHDWYTSSANADNTTDVSTTS